MFIISKEFHFSASHQLVGLAEDHPCMRMHGHNYVVRVFLSAHHLNDVGMVKDYNELSIIKEFIDENFDHRHLNEFVEMPTAENIAHFLFWQFKNRIPEISAIEVSETPKTNCRYEPK